MKNTIEKLDKLKEFWLEVFNVKIDDTLPIPPEVEGYSNLGYVGPVDTRDVDRIYHHHLQLNGSGYLTSRVSINKILLRQQARPDGAYYFWYGDYIEYRYPDAQNPLPSYKNFENDGNMYMTPYERIIVELFQNHVHGKRFDGGDSATLCHALGVGGGVILIFSTINYLKSFYLEVNQDFDVSRTNWGYGPRRIII